MAIKHYEDALRRSGANNVVIRDLGTEKFQLLRLPPSVTNEEARAKAKSLGQLAFGLITTRNAWAILVRPEHFVEADKQLNPEYTDLIGDDLLTMPRGDGVRIEIVGVPKDMSDATLVKELAMETLQGHWRCKPINIDRKQSTPGRKTVIAIAQEMPPRVNVRIKTGYQTAFVTIRLVPTTNKDLTHWD